MVGKFKCNSYQETANLAKEFARTIKSPSIICLDGDLGAGKTVFAQGFIKALGVGDYVTSPTFSIMNEYTCEDGEKLYHFDVYRIDDVDEIYACGFDEYIFDECISLIEWANKIKDIMPKEYYQIYITKNMEKGEDYREIEIIRMGEKN